MGNRPVVNFRCVRDVQCPDVLQILAFISAYELALRFVTSDVGIEC